MSEPFSSKSKIARDRDSIAQLKSRFSTPKRLAVIGSMSFSHPATESVCRAIGQKLADFPDLVIITGGVSGIPETVSRSVWERRQTVSTGGSSVYHVQPMGYQDWDYGETVTAGANMEARRKILATLAPLYLLLEGGFGSEQEARLALDNGALLIPVGFTGGVARSLWDELSEKYADQLRGWSAEDLSAWNFLGHRNFRMGAVESVIHLVQRSMKVKGHPLGETPTTTLVESVPELLRNLETSLNAQAWETSDQLTLRLLFALTGGISGKKPNPKSPGLLHYGRFAQLAPTHLPEIQEIDRLWLRYSQGKFGFSGQWQLWQDLCKELGYKSGSYPSIADEDLFAERIGRTDRFYQAGAVKFSLENPTGHLPWLNWRDRSDPNRLNGIVGGGGVGWNAVFYLPHISK